MNRAAHVEIAPLAPAEKALRRLNFTDRTILALKATAKLADYWDSSMPGFGIRVAPSGLKTWIVMYRRPSGNASRMKLGSYPAVALADVETQKAVHHNQSIHGFTGIRAGGANQ
jgi:hypothetical protein